MLRNSVAAFRQRKGMSKSDLARRIRVCPSYITRLENNDIQPSGNVMFRIAECFKCKVEDVFRRVPDNAK
jgi:DNA-binding XRE family transcriptional regulator